MKPLIISQILKSERVSRKRSCDERKRGERWSCRRSSSTTPSYQDLQAVYELDRRHAKDLKMTGIFRQGLQWTPPEMEYFPVAIKIQKWVSRSIPQKTQTPVRSRQSTHPSIHLPACLPASFSDLIGSPLSPLVSEISPWLWHCGLSAAGDHQNFKT
jgi:hypothetical protein